MAFAFSTLREVQFSFADAQNPPRDPSAWSGEIVNSDQWLHLAVVNDPATKLTTLYVNGTPVLRNSSDTVGLGQVDAGSWVLGAGSYAGMRQSGFLGCIGETRVVDHAIGAEQWLTARVAVEAVPTESAAPAESPAATEAPAEATVDPVPTSDAAAPAAEAAAGQPGLALTGADALSAWALVAAGVAAIGSGAVVARRRARAAGGRRG